MAPDVRSLRLPGGHGRIDPVVAAQHGLTTTGAPRMRARYLSADDLARTREVVSELRAAGAEAHADAVAQVLAATERRLQASNAHRARRRLPKAG